MITVGPDGVIYMTVGLVDLEEEEPGLVDHPLFFCPFCGTKLQTPEEVRAKAGAEDDSEAEQTRRRLSGSKGSRNAAWQAHSGSNSSLPSEC